MTPKRLALALAVLIGFGFFALPIAGVLVEVDWNQVWDALRADGTIDAARLSILTASIAAAAAALIGIPLAWALARRRVPGRSVVRAVVLMPMILPPTVAGAALIAAFAPEGLLGGLLDSIGVTLPGTIGATVVAEAFVAAPFFVLAAEAGFRGVDSRLEGAAASLGGSDWFRFRTVSLPLAKRSILAGIAVAWARALGEFGATITFAGDVRNQTHTLPVEVSLVLRDNRDAALALSIPMMAIALIVIVGSRRALFGGDR